MNAVPELVYRAALFSIAAHGEQKRKHTGEPYWTHPYAVAETLRLLGFPAHVVAAAWSHDLIEDTPITWLDLDVHLGRDVAILVDEVTDKLTHADGNRKKRHELNLLRFATLSDEAQSLKLADLCHNAPSIIKHDPDFAKVWMKEMNDEVNVLERGHPELRYRARGIIWDYFAQWEEREKEELLRHWENDFWVTLRQYRWRKNNNKPKATILEARNACLWTLRNIMGDQDYAALVDLYCRSEYEE